MGHRHRSPPTSSYRHYLRSRRKRPPVLNPQALPNPLPGAVAFGLRRTTHGPIQTTESRAGKGRTSPGNVLISVNARAIERELRARGIDENHPDWNPAFHLTQETVMTVAQRVATAQFRDNDMDGWLRRYANGFLRSFPDI